MTPWQTAARAAWVGTAARAAWVGRWRELRESESWVSRWRELRELTIGARCVVTKRNKWDHYKGNEKVSTFQANFFREENVDAMIFNRGVDCLVWHCIQHRTLHTIQFILVLLSCPWIWSPSHGNEWHESYVFCNIFTPQGNVTPTRTFWV